MSIEQSDVIDFIGKDKVSGAIHLTISDHLRWSQEHLIKLQAKLNSYLAFLESGEAFQTYPDATGGEFVIDAIFKYRPGGEASAFLERASLAIQEAGFSLKYGPVQEGYADDDA